jgi:methionyl-tRNA formyltransferase
MQFRTDDLHDPIRDPADDDAHAAVPADAAVADGGSAPAGGGGGGPLRIVFVGAVEGSRIALDALLGADAAPALVVTLPPERSAAHSDFADLTTPAARAGVPVHHAGNVNDRETIEAIRAVEPDLCLVIGWSQICKRELLSIPRLGSIGFHPAPLPRMRGRAVIPWTILMQESVTGSTLFWIDEGVDSGPILLQRTFAVSDTETSRTLYDKHTANLAEMLPEAIAAFRAGRAPRIPQDAAQATYCARRTPADGLIDWREPAEAVLRLVRAVGEPYPGAITYRGAEELIIESATLALDGHRYIGLPGQVQTHRGDGFVVRCGDGNCIEVGSWRSPSGILPKVHERLNGGRP